MAEIVKYCKKCIEDPNKEADSIALMTGWDKDEVLKKFVIGYFTPNDNQNDVYCKYHFNEKLINSLLSREEYDMLISISHETSFIQAMDKLKETNPVEFQLKMSQFRNQIRFEKQQEEQKYLESGYSINVAQIETEQDKINTRNKNKGKNFLIFGVIIFIVSIVFSWNTVDSMLGLSAKKITNGLYGSEMLKWLFLEYAPDLLLLISIIFTIIGIIFLSISNRKK